MKVLIINSNTVISGAELVLMDYINKSKHNFSLYSVDNKINRQFYIENNKNFASIFFSKRGKTFKNRMTRKLQYLVNIVKEAFDIKKLLKLTSDKKYDLIYCNNTGSGFGICLLSKFIKIDVPIILHIHDMMNTSNLSPIVRGLCKGKVTITVSQAAKQELIAKTKFRPEHISVIYNGIDPKMFFPKTLSKKPVRELKIGYAGSIIDRKGVLTLCETFKQLSLNYNNIKLVLAYHHKDDNYYDKVINKVYNLNVDLISLTRDKMNDYYNDIDILVVPSKKDPLPTTVIEAMSAGCIVVGSSVDGIPEMLDNEFLFECENTKELTTLLENLIINYNVLKDSIIKNNFNKIESKFSIDRKVNTMDDFFDDCIKNKFL